MFNSDILRALSNKDAVDDARHQETMRYLVSLHDMVIDVGATVQDLKTEVEKWEGPQPDPNPQPNPNPNPNPQPQPGNKNPFLSATMYIDPNTQAAAWMKTSDPNHTDDLRLMKMIAVEPQGFWILPEFDPHLADILSAAKGQVVLLNIYGMINRDNGGYSGGGAKDEASYRAWIDGMAGIIASHQDTHVVCNIEPDALDFTIDGPQELKQKRFDLLKYASDTLTFAGATCYIAVGWKAPQDVAAVVGSLGTKFRGFCLNTSGFDLQSVLETKAHDLFNLTGKPSIIDTSRNGNGPWNVDQTQQPWCNPPDRALGLNPQPVTNNPSVDAYVWAKRPGESDGPNRGPAAGVFMPDYALMLARNRKS